MHPSIPALGWVDSVRLPLRFQSPLKPRRKLAQRNSKCSAELPEFNHVKTALAPLALADESLRFVKLLRKFNLGQTGLKARLSQHPEEHGVPG